MSDTGTDTGTDTVETTVAAIRRWLIERVAFYLERTASSVDPDAGFVEMGLDSVYAMTLSGDVEDRFDLEIEPTLAWDYPTVNALAGYLSEELTNR
jgi:acyl carrier protein